MQSPFVLVIFGATGDLMRNKLIPALFGLFKENQLPQDFFVVGFSRRDLTDSAFAEFFEEFVSQSDWKEFTKHLSYQQGDFNTPSGYESLVSKLELLDKRIGACITRIFYLATPPENYEIILQNLQDSKLSEGCGQGSSKWTRIAIEKPFGKDLRTAKSLDRKLATIFEERQIFRVDHYLGKETLQNLLIFRFANCIFEPLWNKDYIDNVQITFAESKGIGKRGKFFDGVGMLRDVGQNHIMQLIAAIAMEMPRSFSKEGVRDARANLIKQIACIETQDVKKRVIRGQYNGYLSEKDVVKNSTTETFIAAKVFINTPRFANVPFYIRAGKAMKEDIVEMSIVFKQTCHLLFKEIGCPEEGNILTIRIQPHEGIALRMIAKAPGKRVSLKNVNMHFSYKEEFGTSGLAAYEKVLLDIFSGDQILFNRSDELESSWTFIEKILTGWEKAHVDLLQYDKGSWGPKEADGLMEQDARKWI